jgi:PHD/YefM family antitoxin component YafN of YafNO toxin-antitoxin module
MKEISTGDLRRSLRRLARTLERTGEPVLLRLRREEIGVIISLRDFRERFALRAAAEERRRLVEEILADRRPGTTSVQQALDEVRGP